MNKKRKHGLKSGNLRAILKDMTDTRRWLVRSRFAGSVWFQVSTGNWCSDINAATWFKRKAYAIAIRRVLKAKDTDVVMKHKKSTPSGPAL